MRVSVRANPIGGIQPILCVAVDRKGFEFMIEPDYVSPRQARGRANLDPPVNIGHRERREGVTVGTAPRRRKLTLDVIPRVLYLAKDRWDDFAPRAQETLIRSGTVIFDQLM